MHACMHTYEPRAKKGLGQCSGRPSHLPLITPGSFPQLACGLGCHSYRSRGLGFRVWGYTGIGEEVFNAAFFNMFLQVVHESGSVSLYLFRGGHRQKSNLSKFLHSVHAQKTAPNFIHPPF